MDVVSDAISAVRLGRPSCDRVRAGGSWAVRLAPYDGIGFHIVLAGRCWLLPDGGAPVSAAPGAVLLLPRGTGHVIADAPLDAAAAARAVPFERRTVPSAPPDTAARAVAFERQAVPPAHPETAARAVPFERRPVPPAPSETAARAVPFERRSVPPAPPETELLCGKYRLDRALAHPLLAELPDVVHLPRRTGGRPELCAAIDLIGGELAGGAPGASVALPHLLDLLLIYMIRAWLAEDAAGTWPAALGDPVTAAALRALHADPAAPWTADALAAAAGVSRATLARRFTALVGRPPMAYLTWWRLTLAAALLRDTTETLAAVAHRVGYATPYALSHAFVRQFRTTPGRYRDAGSSALMVTGTGRE
ncbi:AraC family transcriptional regulator [Actinomadura atramentaria]|uniref:AraC family transcriptional regulator n=1 Tax=Actinomadura atramentaria TaxID=1990 RepID=UPI000379EAF5|nr:AraC family transcriptional regulator [Actinomadura atramentaria]